MERVAAGLGQGFDGDRLSAEGLVLQLLATDYAIFVLI